MSGMRIQRPRPGILELTKSRAKAASRLAFLVLFFGAWYSIVFASRDAAGDSSGPFMLLFYLAPLFAVPELVRHLKVVSAGETFTLNGETKLIERNGVRLAHFTDVERVQIRTIHDSEGSHEYRLSVVLRNEEKLRIHQSSDAEEVTAAAEDIADMLDVEVTRKSGSRDLSLGLGDA